MQRGDALQRVCIYLNERDLRENRALHIVVLEHLQREGATGATALRGMGGFGPGQRMRAVRSVGVTETQPVVIEWVDRVERVARILPTLDGLTGDALITIEDVYAYRAHMPVTSQFGSQAAREIMRSDVALGEPGMLVRDGIALLLEHTQELLPVLDQNRRVLATLSENEFIRRGEMAYPLRIIQAMTPAELTRFLNSLPARSLAEIQIDEPRNAYEQATIPQVVSILSEWGLPGVAVVDRTASFVGLISLSEIMQAAWMTREQLSASPHRSAEFVPAVSLLMQTSVPVCALTLPAVEVLQRLLTQPERFLVLTEESRPVGILDDVQVLRALPDQLRSEWFKVLWQQAQAMSYDLSGFSGLPVAEMVEPVSTVQESASQDLAIQMMSEQNLSRLLVLREDGSLAGLLSRRAMVRALAQEE